MSREVIIAGNWKMYKNSVDAVSFFEAFSTVIVDSAHLVYLAVPYTLISLLSCQAKGTKVVIGSQNMHDALEGAYTGEVSAGMLIDAGASFVILGHSERRHLFGEDSAFVNRKVKRALDAGLKPIVCIGETQEERENREAEKVLEQQLKQSLAELSAEHLRGIVIAYEPVWAIGTGLTATPEQAQKAHSFCRSVIKSNWNDHVAEQISILYGGSVKPENVSSIMGQPDVDGVLVGGASLKPDMFAQIVNYQTMKV